MRDQEDIETPLLRRLDTVRERSIDEAVMSNTLEEVHLVEMFGKYGIMQYQNPILRALNSEETYDYMSLILKQYVQRETLIPILLTGIFEKKYQKGSQALLLEIEPTPDSCSRLALALGHPVASAAAYEVLEQYIDSHHMVSPLVAALKDNRRAEAAASLLRKCDPEQIDRTLVSYLIATKEEVLKRSLVNILVMRTSEQGINALVGALHETEVEPYIPIVLVGYGSMHRVVKNLCGALNTIKNPETIKRILIQYGASRTTVQPLIGAL